ncbi:MAG TPA: XrtA/PEP-CTERM system TPR-repeat protein PrsT [Aliidongia sp.]|uniref:XrtA/PEP-CTERM system TPR-repeat protein PrsT n=1 Tax=Aliidongia sp. TaxID=1914230 RepID=UPI002DDCA7B1|nr:XrtA/PEP-CTERM system TPR-repeat protein PrsT [Aliidongia sp.]HEV2673676.1 XrtA/PEP-CTERM system TPR-repeat protein PrsT [Aliidongia sp.]
MRTVFPTSRARLFTAVSGVALLAVLAGCDGSDKKQSSSDYYNKAVEYRAKGDSKAALIETKNALQADAKNNQARVLRAQLFLDSGDISGAEDELRAASTAGAPARDWFPLLGQALLLEQNFVKVRDLVNQNTDKDPAIQAKANAFLGEIALSGNNLPDARKSFSDALALNDKEVEALLGMAQVDARANALDKTADWISKARAIAPHDPEVDRIQAMLDSARGDQAAVEADLRKASNERPDNPFYRLMLAQALVSSQKDEEADKLLTAVLKRMPEHPLATHLRAVIRYRASQFKETDELETTVLAKVPNMQAAQYIDGLAKYMLGQYSQAEHLLNGIPPGGAMGNQANFVRGAALMQLGRREEGYKVLQPLEHDLSGNPRYLELTATAARANNDLPKSLDLFQKALAADPQNAAVLTQLASVKLDLGDVAGGTANLEHAIQVAPDDEKTIGALFQTLLRNKEYDQAQELAAKERTAHPTKPQGWVMGGMAHALAGKQDEAINDFQQALKVDPAASDAVNDLAGLYLQQGRIDLARAVVEDGYKHAPKNAAICAMGSQVESAAKNPAGMETWLERDLEIEPKSTAARAILVKTLIETNQPQKAISIALTGQQLTPGDPAILKALGQSYLAARQFSQAASTLRDLVSKQPDGDNYYLLTRAYIELHDESRLRDAVEQLVQKAPDYRPGRVLLARVLLDQKETVPRAETMIAALATEQPDDPAVIELQARAANLKSGPKAAVDILQKYKASKKTMSRDLELLLASAQWDAGDHDKGTQTLAAWTVDHPDDQAARMSLATRQIQGKHYDDAHKTLAEEIRLNPGDWVALNNLAWVLMTQGDLAGAQTQIDGAHKIAGTQPDVLDTEGQIALARGDAPHAVEILKTATGNGTAPAPIRIHLAKALIAAGKPKEAQDTLKTLIASAKPGSDLDEAKALLATIKN